LHEIRLDQDRFAGRGHAGARIERVRDIQALGASAADTGRATCQV
jgi:hypothetical protein